MDVESGESGDISPGEVDVPPISLGGAQDFVFSPDGSEIAFIMNPDSVPAVSTNNSLFVQKLDGIATVGAARRVSHNDAMELEPRYSPDGRYLAFLGAERPGYEADRLRVKLVDRAAGAESVRVLTEDFDRSVSSYVWRSAEELLFLAEDRGYMSLYGVGTNKDNGAVVQYTAGLFQSNLRLIDENRVFVTREATHYPAEPTVLRLQAPAAPDTETGPGRPVPRDQELLQRLTLNASLFEELRVRPVETFWYRGADDDWVHAFMLKPPDFDPEARYPLMLLIHGGPQGAFADNFHFRWNAQLFAAEGYIVLMTNPRGSTGYGAGFTDQISGDWTGRCYTDIMNGVDAALERFSFIDPERMAAAGASFGGFMINWIAGHSTRFRALVSHDGIFNQETMSYTTDELWFDMWEHGGMPYENPEEFRRTSPHAAVEAFRTPTLVIQGEQDYRCPPSEGIGMFTALQVRGVPSRLLYFPDEGHFVTKPANAEVWYKTVLEFLAEWI
jgi:dipeptidyl aminopeptidase/acylaminoacyl peptidase